MVHSTNLPSGLVHLLLYPNNHSYCFLFGIDNLKTDSSHVQLCQFEHLSPFVLVFPDDFFLVQGMVTLSRNLPVVLSILQYSHWKYYVLLYIMLLVGQIKLASPFLNHGMNSFVYTSTYFIHYAFESNTERFDPSVS